MPGTYKVSADIRISTNIEPDGYFNGIEDTEGVTEVIETSSFYGEDVTAEGSVEIMVEAENEDEARERGTQALDNASFASRDIEWEIEDYDISEIEEITPPMDMERALVVIREFLTRMREMGGVNANEEEAFSFLLDNFTP